MLNLSKFSALLMALVLCQGWVGAEAKARVLIDANGVAEIEYNDINSARVWVMCNVIENVLM